MGQRDRGEVEVSGNLSHAIDQPEDEPGRRSDDQDQAEKRDENGGEPGPAAEPNRYPFEHRIERDREHHAPDDDRNKRKQQKHARVEEEAERDNAQHRLDRERSLALSRVISFLAHATNPGAIWIAPTELSGSAGDDKNHDRAPGRQQDVGDRIDRKSTRLNSSHVSESRMPSS